MAEENVVQVDVDGVPGGIEFRSWKSVQKFLKEEQEFWSWLKPGDQDTDQFGVATRFAQEIQTTTNVVESDIEQNYQLSEVIDDLSPYRSDGFLIYSRSSQGFLIEDIRSSHGDSAAAFAYGLMKRVHGISSASTVEHLRGAMLAAFPSMIEPAKLALRLSNERSNIREALRRFTERFEQERLEQDHHARRFFDRLRRVSIKALRNRRRFFDGQRDEWQQRADASVASIGATETAYKEAMKLQASVEYWREKAVEHENKQTKALVQLMIFFPVSLILILIAFGAAGWFVIYHAESHQGQVPTALYVVLSGGLAVLSTMVLWIGRLLTKLYLSEHHLRNDAEERAVMTTTYLALTKEHAAEEADRQIVLSALFRATPDGIVKDDGPGDASLQGVIAKALSR